MRVLPWAPLALAGLVSPMLRTMWTMRYLWQRPHALDGEALTQWLGQVPHTALEQALQQALAKLESAGADAGRGPALRGEAMR